MSGAEAALLGVGILCNAMQIITFAKDSIHVDQASKRGLRGKIAASKKSAVALWRGKELQDAEKNLQRHEQLLHSLLLDRVCSQSQASEITSLEPFQHLQGYLQSIISQLAHGSTNVSDLVTDFSANMSNRVADEHATTRTVIEDQITSAENTIRQSISQSIDQLRQELLDREQDKAFKKKYEQLLSSLRFPDMNSRRNHILNNYPGTFNWIFDQHGLLQSDCGLSSESDLSDMDSQLSEDTQDSDAETTDDPGFDSFADWLESDLNVFWVSGKPASGKSSLMKFLAFNHQTVDHLKTWQSNVHILAHFF
ncbi:hypothetical protein FOYG_07532 [Fusarium oxysporum NRRL 32931]|uniref:Nephrocystin 3-like N-terminal domain-containing protein n=1 Tax=Fusarium oxysporum NRRL 32931 TaxID=660029 RepID=W9I5J1_FUSOX|nr:hypothetical protein FOYG_07532 [Fusarium oxysporum NRRL 32931]